MTIKYFKDAKTVQQLRKIYVKLLKQYHPDNGGDLEICKIINTEYDYLLGRLPKGAAGENQEDQAMNDKDFEIDKNLREMLNKIIRFAGIEIEVVGTWVWVDGNTYPYKDNLKEFGFQWSRNRKKWHWTPYAGGYKRGRKIDFDQIRAFYGAQKVETEHAFAIG